MGNHALALLRAAITTRNDRMSKADRAAWSSARNLAQLGELNARWWEGSIQSRPGFCGRPYEDQEQLAPVIAKLNRAGFLTEACEAAYISQGRDGASWLHRAAVQGFASQAVAERIEIAALDAGLTVVLHDPDYLPRRDAYYGEAVPVTMVDGARHAEFGVQLPARDIRHWHVGWGICHPKAVNALCGAWQIAVIDPDWGRADYLWDVLNAAIVITVTDEVQQYFKAADGDFGGFGWLS
jgi:hypothetical protein